MIIPQVFIDKENKKRYVVNSFDNEKAVLFEDYESDLQSEVLLSDLLGNQCEDNEHKLLINTEYLPLQEDNLFYELLKSVDIAMFKITKRGYRSIIEALEKYFEHDYFNSSFLAVVSKSDYDNGNLHVPFLDQVSGNSISNYRISRYWVRGQRMEYYIFIGW